MPMYSAGGPAMMGGGGMNTGGVRDAITQALMKQPHGVDLYETMAMTLAELGQYDQAIQWQRGAIDAAMKQGHADLAGRMAANLTLYERRTPCRAPWRDDDAP